MCVVRWVCIARGRLAWLAAGKSVIIQQLYCDKGGRLDGETVSRYNKLYRDRQSLRAGEFVSQYTGVYCDR